MRKPKIFIAALLAVVMTLSVVSLVACQKDDSDAAHTIYFYTSQGDKLQKITQTAIDTFQAKYPGWTVKHTTVGGYDDVRDKVTSDTEARQQPDLAYCYPDHVASFLKTGIVVNMNDYIYSTDTVLDKDGNSVLVGYTAEEVADFVPGYWEEGYARNYAEYDRWGLEEDDMLTLPFSKSTEVMFTNISALKYAYDLTRSGGTIVYLDPADNTLKQKYYPANDDEEALFAPTQEDSAAGKPVHIALTWDELWAQCRVLKKIFPLSTPLGYDSEANWFITMCQQNGWEYTRANGDENYTFYNEDAEEWLESLTGYYNEGLFTTEEVSGAYTSNLFQLGVGKLKEDTKTGLVTQDLSLENEESGCIYCIGSTGGAGYQKSNTGNFKVAIYPIPGSDLGGGNIDRSCISQGPSLVMLQGGYRLSAEQQAEKLKMTFLFVKELLDPSFQIAFAGESGYNVVRQSIFDDEDYIDGLKDEGTSVAMAQLAARELSDWFFVSDAFDGSSNARTQVGNAVVYVIKGEKTADRALKDAYQNCAGKAPGGYYVAP